MKINGTIKNKKDILATKCYEMMKNMYKKDYSEIINIFYGISVTQIKDYISDEVLSASPEPFSILSLSIPTKKECTIFNCLDYYLITSRDEGGPRGIFEAMACGVPVITTNVGHAHDHIKNNVNGYKSSIDDYKSLSKNILKLSLQTNAYLNF